MAEWYITDISCVGRNKYILCLRLKEILISAVMVLCKTWPTVLCNTSVGLEIYSSSYFTRCVYELGSWVCCCGVCSVDQWAHCSSRKLWSILIHQGALWLITSVPAYSTLWHIPLQNSSVNLGQWNCSRRVWLPPVIWHNFWWFQLLMLHALNGNFHQLCIRL